MRNLIYIPIIHTQADMGALAESFRAIAVEKIGRERWKSNMAVIEQFWAGIRQEILKWVLPFPHVRLYQDGLPVCGCEADIVADLAKSGSANHQLLVQLMGRGATLMGTESPELLIEEYNLVQRVLAARSSKESARIREQQKTLSQRLLLRRDEFVSKRVNETLGVAETGVLFLGMLHSPMQGFARDIQVSYPVGRPGFPERTA